MEDFKLYILGKKNTVMLLDLITGKLSNNGINISKNDKFLQKNVYMITKEVVNQEIKNILRFDNKNLLLVNNIIIKESVNYISNLYRQQTNDRPTPDILSSTLSDEEDTEDYFEELKTDNREPAVIAVSDKDSHQELKVKTTEEILFFDETDTKVQMKNVVSAELVSMSMDFSDYIVNESNCNFCVDNEEKSIDIGNYTVKSLMEALEKKVAGVSFKTDELRENVTISIIKNKQRKSLSGSIKDNDKNFNVDFGVKNSICYLLGFEPRTYILKDELVSEQKHNICLPKFIDISIVYGEDSKESHRILTNVNYNDTIHYKPSILKPVIIDNAQVENVVLKTEYNSRRPYTFSVKFKKLII